MRLRLQQIEAGGLAVNAPHVGYRLFLYDDIADEETELEATFFRIEAFDPDSLYMDVRLPSE